MFASFVDLVDVTLAVSLFKCFRGTAVGGGLLVRFAKDFGDATPGPVIRVRLCDRDLVLWRLFAAIGGRRERLDDWPLVSSMFACDRLVDRGLSAELCSHEAADFSGSDRGRERPLLDGS
jgi:hypothetical protein